MTTTDWVTVRECLRTALQARGHQVASDSHALRGQLYIVGAGDLVQALFEFKATGTEAFDGMVPILFEDRGRRIPSLDWTRCVPRTSARNTVTTRAASVGSYTSL